MTKYKRTSRGRYGYAVMIASVCALLVVSCDTPFWEQRGMFYDIEHEVKLEDGDVNGNVYSLIKFNGRLYAANGLIWSKDPNEVRGWSEFEKPGNRNDRVIRIARGQSGGFALTAYTDDDSNKHYKVWGIDPSGPPWALLKEYDKEVAIFGTNTDDGNAHAYINDGDKVYKLDLNYSNWTDTGEPKTRKAAAWNGSVQFSDKAAFCSDGTSLFTGDSSTVNSANSQDAGSLVYSLWAHGGYLYAGTASGAKRFSISGGTLGAAESLPGGNVDAALGGYAVLSIYADDKAIYAASVGHTTTQGSKRNGLWGYYWTERAEWNRE